MESTSDGSPAPQSKINRAEVLPLFRLRCGDGVGRRTAPDLLRLPSPFFRMSGRGNSGPSFPAPRVILAYEAWMPRLPQHERLASMADDLATTLVEETRIGTAMASLIRMQIAVLRGLMNGEELQPSGLIMLADSTDILIKFLCRHESAMDAAQRQVFENLRAELTGFPCLPKSSLF